MTFTSIDINYIHLHPFISIDVCYTIWKDGIQIFQIAHEGLHVKIDDFVTSPKKFVTHHHIFIDLFYFKDSRHSSL